MCSVRYHVIQESDPGILQASFLELLAKPVTAEELGVSLNEDLGVAREVDGGNVIEPARRHVHVLMSTGGEEEFTKLFTLLFNKRLGARYDFQVREISHASKFLGYAERNKVDLFLIILNNIVPDAHDIFPASLKRGSWMAEIVSHLKQKYHKPVIALCGWPDDEIETEVRRAGAEYYALLPVDGDPLVEAVRTCLEPPK